jgi:pimeloyl-ACP methyl ester carboxylesterase
MVSVADTIVLNALAVGTLESKPVVAAFAREMLCRQDPKGYALACDALAASEAPLWEEIRSKVAIVLEGEDKVSTSQVGDGIAALLSKAAEVDVLRLSAVGHWHILEAPEEAARLIKQAVS